MTTKDTMSNTETTLKSWTHPGTGEVRVYVRNPILSYSDKCFFTERDMTPGHCRLVIQSEDRWNNDLKEETICQDLQDGGIDPLNWEDIINNTK
jgi:hypothetical protein